MIAQNNKGRNNHRVKVYKQGSGQPIIFIHGILRSHRYWNEVAKYISKDKYKLITPDLIGFGQSDKPNKLSYNIDDHAKMIEKVFADNEISQAIIVGHSMGAMIALKLAQRNSQYVKSLVLINPLFYDDAKHAKKIIMKRLNPLHKIYISNAGIIIHKFRNNILKGPMLSILRYNKNNIQKDIINDYLNHTHQSFKKSLVNTVFNYNMYPDLKNTKIKTRYIYCRDDPFFAAESLDRLKDLPHIKFIELSGKHNIPIVNAQQVSLEICG